MRNKFHLAVGINDYPGTDSDLAGCVNDARDWTEVTRPEGYEVSLLTDSAATKAAIVNSLEALVAKARLGDRILFTYSGHGTWVPDKNGDEIDKRDEALVCHDFRSGGLITDDELYAIFEKRRHGVRVTVVPDSCHSGTLARLIDAQPPPGVIDRRFLPPHLILDDVSTDDAIQAERTLGTSRSRPGTVMISGCADHEFSYDAYFNGRPNGAQTYFLLKAVRRHRTVNGVYKDLRGNLPIPQYPQTPQLQASRYQRYSSLL